MDVTDTINPTYACHPTSNPDNFQFIDSTFINQFDVYDDGDIEGIALKNYPDENDDYEAIAKANWPNFQPNGPLNTGGPIIGIDMHIGYKSTSNPKIPARIAVIYNSCACPDGFFSTTNVGP